MTVNMNTYWYLSFSHHTAWVTQSTDFHPEDKETKLIGDNFNSYFLKVDGNYFLNIEDAKQAKIKYEELFTPQPRHKDHDKMLKLSRRKV